MYYSSVQYLDVEVYAQDGEEDDGGAAQDHDLQQGHNQPRQRQASKQVFFLIFQSITTENIVFLFIERVRWRV